MQVVPILRVDDLKKDFLHIRLIRLVLDDLGELNPVHFCRYESLHLVK